MKFSREISTELDRAYNNFNPKEPVSPISEYYVNCDNVRGEQGEYVANTMSAELSMMSNDYAHFLFTGHVGSGKSSELLKTQELLEEEYGFQVVYFDAAEELDLYDVHHTDLLLAVASQLFKDTSVEIDAKTLENVQSWFKEVTKTTVDSTQTGAQIESGVRAGGGFPWLGELFAGFKANILRNKEQRAEIREHFRPKVSDLLKRVNRLIDAARTHAQSKGFQDLVLIIDNLEKMSPNILKEESKEADVSLFVDYGNLLLGLDCHLICTVPIRLLYLPLGSKLHDDFSNVYTLPVVKIKEYRSATPNSAGVEAFKKIADLRLKGLSHLEASGLFGGQEALLEKIVQFCGGNVKTFIRIMRQTIFQCKLEKALPLTEKLIEKVFRQEMRDYDRMIPTDRIKRLVQVACTHEIDIHEKSLDSEMLQLGWILVYANGQEWCDVEPVIRCLERFQKLWQKVETESCDDQEGENR